MAQTTTTWPCSALILLVYVVVGWNSEGLTMRNLIAVLIILIGLALLILAHRISGSSDSCEHDPSYFERGTYADCEARSQKAQIRGLVADSH